MKDLDVVRVKLDRLLQKALRLHFVVLRLSGVGFLVLGFWGWDFGFRG